jgi:iduronate 2-sulfatase
VSYHFLLKPAILLAAIWPALGIPVQAGNEGERPNILLIMVDDLNDYLGVLGHPNAQTPHMDSLAEGGVLFTNAHCQAPICGPSRASLMSGLRPSTTGIYGQIDDEDLRGASEMMHYVKFLPEYLRDEGYYTMGIGKLFHRHAPEGVLDESGGRNGGFGPTPPDGDHFKWDAKGTSTDWGAYPADNAEMPDVQSAEWAVERLGRSYDQPFFLGVGFFRPHVPWYVPQEWFDRYEADQLVTPPYRPDDFEDIPGIAHRIDTLPMMPSTKWAIQSGEWPKILEAYLACITFVDAQIGKVLEALEHSPHADNTVVILMSDHGYRLGEKGTFAKNCLWEEATRVPLMIGGPGIAGGRTCEDPVELLDLYPTILDLAGLPAYALNEGKSLRPVLMGGALPEDRVAITTYGRNNHAVISKNFRYIRYEDGTEELYDLWKDPHSFHNAAAEPAYAAVKSNLAAHLPQRNRAWAPPSEQKWPQILVEQRAAKMAEADFSVEEGLAYGVDTVRTTVKALPAPDAMPATIPHGERFWELKPVNRWGWTHGFWPGVLWQAYEASRDPKLLAAAETATGNLKAVLNQEAKSHDLGFIFNCSFGNGLRVTGNPEYGKVLLQAADKLAEFYNPKVGTLLSWPAKVRNGEYAPYNTIIDSLMNLELLFRASEISGDPRYREMAISHANRVMETHVRDDFTTCHLVLFDDQTGEVLARRTHQGYSDDSLWARGQAWGIYGFTMCYRETGIAAYRNTALEMARVFLERLPPDRVPYWDFDDPAIPGAPRDASAAAIAASALLELSGYVSLGEDQAMLVRGARQILVSLSTDTYRSYGHNAALLDHSTGSKPRGREIDVPIIYADYYYLEALNRLNQLESAHHLQ